MRDVIHLSQELISRWDSFEDHYPSNLRDRPLDWVVPRPKGTILGFAEMFNEQSPNGRVRDIRQNKLDLDERSPEGEHLVIRDRIRETLRDGAGRQVYSIRFYQVPAPKLTVNSARKATEYLEEVFRAQDALSDEEWIREPKILLESGGKGTMLADAEDAEWVADMYPPLKNEYSEIGFVVDLEESDDPEDMLGELPDGLVKKVRVPNLDTSIPSRVGDRVPKSIII